MSLRNLKSLKRKKYQRAMNKIVKTFNKSIEEDWLWNGRFTMRQDFFACMPYEDHSGMACHFVLQLKDNKTGLVEENCFSQYDENDIWHWANDCITTYWDVWKEVPNPNEQARLEGREPPVWPY